jgi:hypothetical protein
VVKFKKKTIIRISHGTTPLKKIPSVTQTSLQVGKGSMFGPLSRTPPQHPVHGPFDLVGYSGWLQKGPHNSSGSLKCRSSTGCVPPTCKEVWVTEGIFFNGVVPWEILIMVFFKFNHYISDFYLNRCTGI